MYLKFNNGFPVISLYNKESIDARFAFNQTAESTVIYSLFTNAFVRAHLNFDI